MDSWEMANSKLQRFPTWYEKESRGEEKKKDEVEFTEYSMFAF